MQLDFFSDPAPEPTPTSTPAARGASPTKADLGWAKHALLVAFEGRKLALKTLEENVVAFEGLLHSIWNVACAKRISYDQALLGQARSNFGWADTPIAADIAILSSFHISLGQIPMSPCAARQ